MSTPPPIRARGFALAALVVGLIAFLVALLPVAGLITATAAIGLAALTLLTRTLRPLAGSTQALAIVGGALGALAIVISVVVLAIG